MMSSLLHELTLATGLPLPEIERIVATAPVRYKVYQIPKKRGGWRQIAHPAKELKLLQRVLLDRYLQRFPVHQAAMAYVRGRNIGDNAEFHSRQRLFLKLDFERFFTSIKAADWGKFLKKQADPVFDPNDVSFATQILFWGEGSMRPKCLSIGAPTSPILSNMLLYDLDVSLTYRAKQCGVLYTRYADDMTVSGPSIEQVLSFEKGLREEVANLRSPKLKFNDDKRGIYGRGQRRMVTGLVVTPHGQVSIGRERKRMISSLVHRFSLGQLDEIQTGLMKGMLGFAIANEPRFMDRLRMKYGDQIIDAALRVYIPDRAAAGSKN